MEVPRRTLRRWKRALGALADVAGQDALDLADEINDLLWGRPGPKSDRNYFAQANRRIRDTDGRYYYPAKSNKS